MNTQQGIYKAFKPTAVEQAEIMQLVDVCNQHDGLVMRLNRDMWGTRTGAQCYDYLFYEDGVLVGYLNMSSWGVEEKELLGMVHPQYRRRGIFRSLLATAREEARSWGVKSLALVCEHVSVTGKAFVATTGAQHELSEHEMWLADFHPKAAFDEHFHMRPATLDDLDALAEVLLEDSGRDKELMKQRIKMFFEMPSQRFFLATLYDAVNARHEPIGSLRLDGHEDFVGIYSFVVKSMYRGRGYGGLMLTEAIRLAQSEGLTRIMLDVDVSNRALHLYLATGFVVKTTYDYYHLDNA